MVLSGCGRRGGPRAARGLATATAQTTVPVRMPTQLSYAWLKGPRDISVEHRPLDTQNLGPHDVWAHTIVSALKIGTDRGNFEGAEHFPGAPDYPRFVGDSNCAVVRAVGTAVAHFRVGERIVTRWPHQVPTG
jgi:threonine dehydrogenase-like Zn-dependent dehydrogenase